MNGNRTVDLFMDRLIALDRLGAQAFLVSGDNNGSMLELAEDIITPALEKIGKRWENGSYSLSQVYMSSRLCEQLMDTFLPGASPDRIHQPAMAIALLDDYHSLGKTIVYSALRASGYELKDYGRCSVEELITRVREDAIRIILISTLMLRSALLVKQVVNALNPRDDVKIIVGGAPFRFDSKLWEEVGADAVGTTGMEAVGIVSTLMEELS